MMEVHSEVILQSCRGTIDNAIAVSYSKLVWSGFKDLFKIFLRYLNIPFSIVGKEMHPEGKSST